MIVWLQNDQGYQRWGPTEVSFLSIMAIWSSVAKWFCACSFNVKLFIKPGDIGREGMNFGQKTINWTALMMEFNLQDRVDLLLEGFRPGRERERDKAQLLSPTRQPESKGEAGSSSYHAPAPAQGPPPGPSNPAPQLPAWFPSIHVKHNFLITRLGCNGLTMWSFHRFFLIIWSRETYWLSFDHLIVRNTTVAPCENFIYQWALRGYLGVLINRSLVVCYWFHELLINCI